MMGYSRLSLLLLLSCCTAAQDIYNQPSQVCPLASRLKAFKKYVYQYTAESQNGVVGTASLRNGPRVSCQVEVDVPDLCSFSVHTRDCALSEVSVMDPQGQPVFSPAAGSEPFRASMEKNPLNFLVDSDNHVHLFPETDEPVNILNIKRGIISALLVPHLEEGPNLVNSVHGHCMTEYLVNIRQDIATDVTLSRDLSQCDHSYGRDLTSSPLALLQKLNNPLSKLIESTQSCNYQFDNKQRHITTATCTERHIYLPFSHGENGMSSVVRQDLSFQSVKRSSRNLFSVDPGQAKPFHFEDPDDKAPVQTKDAVLNTLQELVALGGTDQGQKRTSLFHQLVSGMRVLRNETLSQTVAEMADVSKWLTFQALVQCGTPECTSAIMQMIWTIDGLGLEVDALVYGLSLQADPDAARVQDMLSMAQYKQSKAIMYALANTVKKFHKGTVTPVVTEVSEFMKTLLNDCSNEVQETDSDSPPDPKEVSFLVLKVIGVMGQAMQDVSPSLISSILRCVQKTDIPLLNHKAAIQAFRLMDINDEIRSALMEVYQDTVSPVEKRVAAYLILMKNPDRDFVRNIIPGLLSEREEQLKSFVISHLNNIRNSDEARMQQVKEYLEGALQDELAPSKAIFEGLSRSYRMDSRLGSIQSNVILNGQDTLPKELMLEATLKGFEENYDIFEIGVDGTGFEPTIAGLFGEKGLFGETLSRLIYLTGDNFPALQQVLNKILPRGDKKKRQVEEDPLEAIRERFQKLVNDVRFSQAPEAMAYLRLLGNEIGYLKTSEMRKIFESIFMYYHIFFRILPAQAFSQLTSSAENELFFHYIFMENAFSLPTSAGFPLKFSLSGVFAPGARGGLTPSSMTDLSFMPSVGLEFITHMGVHIPDYVDAGIEMHTSAYHESSFNARITMKRNQIRLSIPAPTSNTQLVSVSNKLLSISSGQTKAVPSLVEDRVDSTDCQPLFSGLNLCKIVRYSNPTSEDQAPYYPLNGESKFALEIQPTGKVSEYTATITYKTPREGRRSARGLKVPEALKLTLRAEGDEPVEATASFKYDRNTNIMSAEVLIPDYDVEAGIRLAVADGVYEGKKIQGITIDVTNKNVPQLTLIGRARLEMMKEAVLQLQMDVPALKTDVSVTAVLKKDEDVHLFLEMVAHLLEISYEQKARLKYDDDKFEVELNTDLNSEIRKMIPNADEKHEQLQKLIDDILDQKVTKTDMKLRHIVSKGIEAGNIWLDKLTARFPSLANLRSKRSISDLTLPALPQKLFLQYDSLFRYQFNKDKIVVTLHPPLGGKTSEELDLPKDLSVPVIDLPHIGLHIPANKYPLPSFSIPPSLDLTIPLLGLAEVSSKIKSNFYNWEGSITGGNDTTDVPSYVALYKSTAESPLKLLSYKLEGAGMITGRSDDSIKYLLNSSFSHSLIDTSFSLVETFRVTDKLNANANYKLKALSPLGLDASLLYSAQSMSTLDSEEVSGDGTVDGLIQLGWFHSNVSYTHSYNLRPLDRQGRGESTLHFDSPIIQLHNTIQGSYANSELNIVSRTSALRDIFKHVAELKYKDGKTTLKCNAAGQALGISLTNKVELGISSQMSLLRIESQAHDNTNRVYSLISGSLDPNGIDVNSEASLTCYLGCLLHKASVRVGRDGLTFSGTNNLQCTPVTMENIFNGGIDSNGASLSSTTKTLGQEGRGELSISGKITSAEASLQGELKGHAYDAATTNNVNLVLKRGALTLTENTKATLWQMKTETSHTLTFTLWTFNLHSKTDNFICDDIYYKQTTKLDVKPFIMSLDMTNDLRLYELSLNKKGHMKLEPVKVDISGIVTGAYGEENKLKHTHELSYDDMAGSFQYSTSGNIMDTQLSHSCEFQFAGFSSTSKCEGRINSEPLRFDGYIRTMALPFSLSIDGLVNSDGEIHLHGKHTGQLFSKLLVKAAPLALAWSHDHQVSTTHTLPIGKSSTSIENKCEGLLSPIDQSVDWKITSKLNKHTYEQVIGVYNNPEKVGIEFSGVMQTDIISRHGRSTPGPEKVTMAGFLKYDKNSDCHIIEIPFIESFPVAFEQLKAIFVRGLESLQQFIQSLNVDQLITSFRDGLQQLPMQVKNLLRDMDLENKVNLVKEKLDYLINEFAVTMDDLELAMTNLRWNLENMIVEIGTKIQEFIFAAEEFVKAGHLHDKITDILAYIKDQLQAFDDKYKIRQSFVKALVVMEDIIRQIDLQKLRYSSTAFLQELDSRYGILETIREKLSELKRIIEDFNLSRSLEDVKDFLLSFDWASYLDQLSYQIPTSEITRIMESMNDVVVNWIDEYEIPNKLNAVYSYFKDLLLKYDFDDILKDLMDQTVILVEQFQIEETVQKVVEALKSIKVEFVYNKVMDFLYSLTDWIRAIDFKTSIDDLNNRISSILVSMKDFDYSAFVDETNVKIAELTKYLNDEIKKYDIVKKVEAVREFFREIQSSIFAYLDELKNTKVADALRNLMDVMDTAFYNDVKLKVQEMLEDMKQRIVDMDIREEMHVHLQRASESYTNMVTYISAQFNQLIENIRKMANDNEVINQMKQAVEGILDQLKAATIEIPPFTVPLTDLEIPGFTINLNRLQDIRIPDQISVPSFTILNSYTIPAFTIALNEIKAKIIAIIDDIRNFKIQTPDPEDIFGDLKVLYLSNLPDLTLSEITLTEIKVPAIRIPKLNLENFEITMLPIPAMESPKIPSDICIPLFGKLQGEFSINSPHYNFIITGKLENSTSSVKTPQFRASVTSSATSPIEPLEYTFEANAQLEAPRMKKLRFTETVRATHMAFSINHEGSLILTGSSAEVSAKTITKATTQMYTADLDNNVALTLKNDISVVSHTNYDHNLDIPLIDTSSQASLKQSIVAVMDSGSIKVTGQTTGDGKWTIQDYSDEGTHRSIVEFNVTFSTAKLTVEGETDCKALKAKQKLTVESVSLSHITVQGKCETMAPFVKNSVLVLNGEAHVGDLKAALTASHEAEFTESLTGAMSNSLEFLAHPFEIIFDVKNKVNSKMFFPLKLTGKADFQHDYGFVLNSEKQRASWFALARFNQYKYSHNFAAENNEKDVYFHSFVNGEFNVDFLTVPLSIPEISIPYVDMTTPELRDYSLWEDAGLRYLFLDIPRQSFDMNLKIQYYKNPDVHTFELYLEPIYNVISDNFQIIQAQFEALRDKAVVNLKDSYNEAKSQYIKHKIDTSGLPPRIFRIPGYTIPVLNIQVSAFRAEMPAFSYFVPKEVSTPSFKVPALGFSVPSYTLVLPSLRLPAIYVPETLSEIKLPTFTLPAVQDNIMIPAMGNLTFDFSFKSVDITVGAYAGLYNQSDIVARFGASSECVFDILNGKIDGTTSLTRKRGLKLATAVSLEHSKMEASHECSVSLTKRSLEGSVANSVKLNLPFLQLEINQQLTGDTKTKPNLSSKKSLQYRFNIPVIESLGNGNLETSWELEALSSFISVEASTQGKSDTTLMNSFKFVNDLENKASFYLNINGMRSTSRTSLNLNIDKLEKLKRSSSSSIFLFNLDNNMAVQLSLRRVFAKFDYTGINKLDFMSFRTNGKHVVRGELDFVPIMTLRTGLSTDASQLSDFGETELIQNINLVISSEKQSLDWNIKEQLGSVIHTCDLFVSNDESEARVEFIGSMEGHLATLKSIKLPVYQKSLWDVLKFDEVTNTKNAQFVNISSTVVYTKSMDGYDYTIPFKLFGNGVTLSIPEIRVTVPSWVREIPQSIRNIDVRFEDVEVPDHLTLPPAISVPAFHVPFTNLHVDTFIVDPKNLEIPKVITTKPFDIMLPGLPVMSVPSYDINTDYLQGKTSFVVFNVPQYDISVSSFTLPKSFTLGEHTISMDEITSQISNFELPNIIIPAQKLEIPEMDLYLPSSVFIPTFGSLSASLKVSSPIYNVSTIASAEKKDSDLVTMLHSRCSSTMDFLEYELTAQATVKYDNGAIKMNGLCHLVHPDVDVNWRHVLAHPLRAKRQIPRGDFVIQDSVHTLNVDIVSRTFADGSFRFASRKDGITASMSSPSAGFLGLQLQRRSPSQLYGKVFSRYLSTPEKDTNVLTVRSSLKNSQKLAFQTTWNWDFLDDAMEGFKGRIPAMTEAVLELINKYHTSHFGFDLKRGGVKLKSAVSNMVEKASRQIPVTAVQDLIQTLADQGKDIYREVSDQLMSMNVQDVGHRVAREIKLAVRHTRNRIRHFLDALIEFLSKIKFTVPGSEVKLSMVEMFQKARQSAARVTERTVQQLFTLLKSISESIRNTEFIRNIEFNVPGAGYVNGEKIMDKLEDFAEFTYHQLSRPVEWVENLFYDPNHNVFKLVAEKVEDILTFIKDKSADITSKFDEIYAETLESLRQNAEEVKRLMGEYKDLLKRRIQEAYDALTVEEVNSRTRDFIGILQANLSQALHESVDVVERVSQSTAPYVRVSKEKVDVEIPLPFFWKSFNEWPTPMRR
ncbi:apolipoprotein B-100 [Cololabis saira]|uniref:apolipoprotein B-100 n=1 Tax=Cololabis saira TaxID=129043 RepID=UPI002AD422A0|nr:apolipoprotein B-100 [Cololabis saira]